MDKNTRNAIQTATQAARKLLEDAYREQLEGTYDILSDGTIAAQAGSHLSDRQKITREKLVAAVAHKRSTGIKAKEAVGAYLREAAFTTLNRFVALKMLEARKLVQECVSKGEESSGFKEFTALAPGLVAVEDKGYRLYIETLFDEIGQEVKVLFDRRDVASLLWPDRQSLLELLGILNVPKLASVWAEDETIGWVYQYFNGEDDIQSARYDENGKPKAPQNSRELAVRNQFFTPRYVVRFLTDNTLGRTWYEMMQGATRLIHLDYLVRRPNEVFLAEGESAPEPDIDVIELSQEELLQQTLHVPFRAKKDPRDLRILDPACGSGHFLLYTFDLLITIYEEAWADVGAAAFNETGTQLRADYSSIEDLRRAMPELILRHNLHGVDIDPRAAQIAALALWMRAQRACNQFDLDRAQRSPITNTNIVVAEPMPGDAELVNEFAASLKPAVLGDLFRKMVTEMKLAGELGSLLKIEESIAKAVKEAAGNNQQGNLFVGKVEDQDFWDSADEKIIEALGDFAESAAGSGGVRRQLFAGDAAQGVAFIELMSKRFDVVLMNPPFGQASAAAGSYIKDEFLLGRFDLGAAFVERLIRRVDCRCFGLIANRTIWFGSRLEPFRQKILERHLISTAVDLGLGVLEAFVETSMWTAEVDRKEPASGVWIDNTEPSDRSKELLRHSSSIGKGHLTSSVRLWSPEGLRSLPGTAFSYWVHPSIPRVIKNNSNLQTSGFETKQGLATMNNDRFIRLVWEPPELELGIRWHPYAKGGNFAPLVRDFHLVVDWSEAAHAAYEKRTGQFCCLITGQQARYAFRAGITYSTRTSRFSAGFFPARSLFDTKGSVIFDDNVQAGNDLADMSSLMELCLFLNTPVVQYLLDLRAGASDAGKARDYSQSMIAGLPFRRTEVDDQLIEAVNRTASRLITLAALCPERSEYRYMLVAPSFEEIAIQIERFVTDTKQQFDHLLKAGNKVLAERIGLSSEAVIDAEEYVEMSHRESAHELLLNWNNKDVAEVLLEGLLALAFKTSKRPTPIESLDNFAETLVFNWASPFSELENDSAGVETAIDVLVDDKGHDSDISFAIDRELEGIAEKFSSESALFLKACEVLGSDPTNWFRKTAFGRHLVRRTLSKRAAPVYWQLATPSASYSVWCYYHRLTRDTFFHVANDYVMPKVDHEERKLNTLRQDAGPDPSSKQRKEIDAQETFVTELRAFLTELKRIAPLWNPNLNDGVIINFAPLWRLVSQHKAWQKECKKVWDKLVKGDYDWAHLAMHLWPERVVPKCQDDRSLAIVHGLEDAFWYENDDDKWQKRQVSSDRVEELVAERTSTAVKAALQDLLDAPAPGGQTRNRRRTSA
ncbi:MAG: BREX-1 system adenine-specific DNA-methyltransferase PglX [Candidatus Thiodiazotropha lotti]|nr:BREX-1 system adenine-specific DNA-methyltransferase PglX [Candidatus Thiodiazotropha lotti]MCW4194433.1 BREX-1 system adenine-specific DNA-methyltransferase PglX [Candidatus Thiodiazotropha lotti]